MVAKLATENRSSTNNASKRNLAKLANLGVAGLLAGLLVGCSVSSNSIALTSYAQVAGNWQFSTSATTAAALPALAGSLSVNGTQIAGTFHPVPAGATINTSTRARGLDPERIVPHTSCAPSTSFPVTGTIASDGKTTLTSPSFAGGTLTIAGTLSPSQTSLTNATVAVSGGPCAVPTSQAVVGKFESLAGTYTGTIYSVTGTSLFVSTNFTQTTAPDVNGTYHLQGNSTFGSAQPCLPAPPFVSDSAVTGSTLAATYSETPPGGSLITVVVDATFTPDASALTLNSYRITGGYCDGDSGHGTLTRAQ